MFKNDIKKLYKVEPFLARKVAKTLGYRITTADTISFEELPEDIKKTLDAIGWKPIALDFIKTLLPIGSYFIKYNSSKTVVLDRDKLKILLKNKRFNNMSASKDSVGLIFKNK